jgi:hypothetical protein
MAVRSITDPERETMNRLVISTADGENSCSDKEKMLGDVLAVVPFCSIRRCRPTECYAFSAVSPNNVTTRASNEYAIFDRPNVGIETGQAEFSVTPH